MPVLDKLADYMQKNPRAALNLGAVMVVIWLAGIIVVVVPFIFNRGDNREESLKVEHKKELSTKDSTINTLQASISRLTFSRDSSIQACLLREIVDKDSRISALSTLNKEYEANFKQLEAKYQAQLNAAISNNNKAERVNKKIDKSIKEKSDEN